MPFVRRHPLGCSLTEFPPLLTVPLGQSRFSFGVAFALYISRMLVETVSLGALRSTAIIIDKDVSVNKYVFIDNDAKHL